MDARHCEDFVQRLDALLGDDIDADERQRLEAHARHCSRCAALLAAMRHPATGAAEPGNDAFLATLMQRTSGAPCKRAEAELPAWIDATLAEEETELLALHLQHCGDCAALAAVLRTLRQDLPALAFADPGQRFTAEVMAATKSLRQRRPSLEQKLADLWQQLVTRPRLAWEFATAASFVLMLLCGLPFSPLRPLPQQALAMVQIDPVGLLRDTATRIEPVLSDLARHTWEQTGEPLQRAAKTRAQSFAQEHQEATATWKQLRSDLSEVGAGIRNRNFSRLSHGLHQLQEDLRQLFTQPDTNEAKESS